MYYLIKDLENGNVMAVGTENTVFGFVNSKTSDAYDYIYDMEQAEYWLRRNGFEIKKLGFGKLKSIVMAVAIKLYDMQEDISYCNSETGILDIDNIDEAVRFLDWVLKREIFDYEYKDCNNKRFKKLIRGEK